MTEQLRIGILGTGNIARQFALGAKHVQTVEVAAVGSRSLESANRFGTELGIDSQYGSYAELLADESLAAVYVSLPNSMHAEWSIKAMRAGKHVLCEKPIAINADEAEQMYDVAEATGQVLVEAFMYRSHPLLAAVRDAIEAGKIGQLRAIRANFCFQVRQPAGNVRFEKDLAGGALMDVGVYCLNFSRFITGEEPNQVMAVGDVHESGVDGLVGGCLHFPSGTVAVFLCGLTAQNDNSVIVCGSEGYLDIPFAWKPPQENAEFRVVRQQPPLTDQKNGNKPAQAPPPEVIRVSCENSLYGQEAADFARTVLSGVPPVISRQDSVANMRVVDQIRSALGIHS